MPKVPALSWEDSRLLIDHLVDYAIFMLDARGRIATWGPGAQAIKGYTADEVVGVHFSKLYPAEDVMSGKPDALLEVATRDGRVEDEGWRLRKDGSRFWASVVITALRDSAGALRGFGKVTRDLTARRATEERLRLAEQRFHHLVDAVVDYAIFMLDPDGHVATWNAGAHRVKGYTADEIIGSHFSVFYTAEDRASGRPEAILDAVRRDGRFEEESWRLRKDGSRFWASVVITALNDERGQLVGFAKVTRDLTARRAAEENASRLLRERTAREVAQQTERRLEAVLEGVADGITAQDRSGRLVFANSAAARICGLQSPAELLSAQPGEILARFELTDAEGKLVQADDLPGRRVLAGHGPGSAVLHVRDRQSGRDFWIHLRASAVLGDDGSPELAINIWHDVTHERRSAQENSELFAAAQRAAQTAEQASRAKDEFLATVSHELRTPLAAILGWSTLLKERNTDPAAAKPITVIHRNAQAQVKIIDDILDVSRIVTGKLRIDSRAADLVAIARDALEVVRPSADAKKVTLTFAAEDAVCPLVADPERLQQVVWNLLSNAVKFTEPGGIVRLAVAHEGSVAEVSVTDTGKGIDPAFLPWVFERFRQADSSTTRRVGGLGLGLAIVRHIVELHGGRVAAASEGAGRGSTFTITLPIRRAAVTVFESAHAPRRGERAKRGERSSLKGVRVLVVDDEPDARDVVAAVLLDAGAEVDTAGSAAEGFERFERFGPDVLVSDIGMPDEDGYSFMRRIRKLTTQAGGRIPSLALTAFAREEDRSKAIGAGYTTHIGKPVDPDALVAAIDNLVMVGAGARPVHR